MEINRGALNLVAAYGESDSSEEDVPACKVSVKRTFRQSEDDEDRATKRVVQRLPVPSVITNSVHKDVHMDDTTLHDGRLRSFPHERGNWATYLYVPYEVSTGVQALIEKLCTSLHQGELKPVDHFHISVTRTVILRHHWINSFVQSARESISCFKKFVIMLGELKIYCNEEKTRTFVGLQVKSGHDNLLNIVKSMDVCLAEFKLPEFYKDPSFHVSIAWCVGDFEAELNEVLSEIKGEVLEIFTHFPEDCWYFLVDSIGCKTGNKVFSFSLS